MAASQSLCHHLQFKDGEAARQHIVLKLEEDLANFFDKGKGKLHRGIHLCDTGCIARRRGGGLPFPVEQKHYVNVILSDHHIRITSIKMGVGQAEGSVELKLEETERPEQIAMMAGDLIALKATRLSLCCWGCRRFPTAYITIIVNDIAYITNSSSPHFHHITADDLTEAEKRRKKVGMAPAEEEAKRVHTLSPPSSLLSVPAQHSQHRALLCHRCIRREALPQWCPLWTASASVHTLSWRRCPLTFASSNCSSASSSRPPSCISARGTSDGAGLTRSLMTTSPLFERGLRC